MCHVPFIKIKMRDNERIFNERISRPKRIKFDNKLSGSLKLQFHSIYFY